MSDYRYYRGDRDYRIYEIDRDSLWGFDENTFRKTFRETRGVVLLVFVIIQRAVEGTEVVDGTKGHRGDRGL